MRLAPAVALAAGLGTCWALLPAPPGVAAIAEVEREVRTEDPAPPPALVGYALPAAPPHAVLSGRGRLVASRGTLPGVEAAPEAAPDIERIALRVDLVDAETGLPVRDATWRLGKEEDRPGGAVAGNGVGLPFAVACGGSERLPLVAIAPPGFVAWDEGARDVRRSRYAQSLRAVHPLRREVSLVVDVRDFDGRWARDARIGGLSVAKRFLDPARTEQVAAGRSRIRGIPFLHREPLEFSAYVVEHTQGTERSVTWTGRIPDESWQGLEIELMLPPPSPIALIGIGGGAGGAFRGRG